MNSKQLPVPADTDDTKIMLAKYRGGPMVLEKPDGTVVFKCEKWADMLEHLRSINHPSLIHQK